jgi:hypothetical protein
MNLLSTSVLSSLPSSALFMCRSIRTPLCSATSSKISTPSTTKYSPPSNPLFSSSKSMCALSFSHYSTPNHLLARFCFLPAMMLPHSTVLTAVFHSITLNCQVTLFQPFPTLFLATSSSSPYQLFLFLVGL